MNLINYKALHLLQQSQVIYLDDIVKTRAFGLMLFNPWNDLKNVKFPREIIGLSCCYGEFCG